MKELNYLLLLDLKTNTFNYDIPDELAKMGVDKRLKNLFIDEAKNYWFVTEDNTFRFYDVEKRKGKIIDSGDSEFTRKYGIPLELAQYKNFCWIVYSSGLIRCWDYVSSEFIFQDSRFGVHIQVARRHRKEGNECQNRIYYLFHSLSLVFIFL
jgi:WD40 repeat protein